jgi:hypothetical protein
VVAAQLIDDEHGWALTELPDDQRPHARHLWWTGDAGRSWSEITPPDAAGRLQSVAFSDARNGWAAVTAGWTATIWRSTDAGATWRAGVPATVAPGIASFAVSADLDVLDRTHLWDVVDTGSHGGFAYKQLLSSRDSGMTWQISPPGQLCGRVRFSSPQAGYSTDDFDTCHATLLETRDGGATWKAVSLPPLSGSAELSGSWLPWTDPTNSGHAIVAREAPQGRAGGATVGFFSTTSGGDRWTLSGSVAVSQAGDSVLPIVLDAQTWFLWEPQATAATSSFEATHDGGRTWQPTGVGAFPAAQGGYPPRVSSPTFSDATHGWIRASYSGCHAFKSDCYQTSLLFGTADGGLSWRYVSVLGQTAAT